MGVLFKIVKMEGRRNEVLAMASNFLVARAAFDNSVSAWQESRVELRQEARVIRTVNEREVLGS